ncbi:MAG: NTP transferase domain-containing protein, partial [Oscillospiraceae bacterium]|nr:NTP transferase domain-containing protein [Oscillospiraceae bacterium]
MNVFAVILAAGYSSRMGVLKPLLPVGGVPAVARTAGALTAAGVSPVVVTGHRAAEIEAALDSAGGGLRVAYNGRYGDGMFSSV